MATGPKRTDRESLADGGAGLLVERDEIAGTLVGLKTHAGSAIQAAAAAAPLLCAPVPAHAIALPTQVRSILQEHGERMEPEQRIELRAAVANVTTPAFTSSWFGR